MWAAVVDTFGTSPRYVDVAEPTPTEHTEVATVLAAAARTSTGCWCRARTTAAPR